MIVLSTNLISIYLFVLLSSSASITSALKYPSILSSSNASDSILFPFSEVLSYSNGYVSDVIYFFLGSEEEFCFS